MSARVCNSSDDDSPPSSDPLWERLAGKLEKHLQRVGRADPAQLRVWFAETFPKQRPGVLVQLIAWMETRRRLQHSESKGRRVYLLPARHPLPPAHDLLAEMP